MAGETSRINGRKGGRPVDPRSKHYREKLLEKVKENADRLTQALIDKGLAGDVTALKEIHDRALGKSEQNIDVKSDGEKLGNFNLHALTDEQLGDLISRGGTGDTGTLPEALPKLP